MPIIRPIRVRGSPRCQWPQRERSLKGLRCDTLRARQERKMSTPESVIIRAIHEAFIKYPEGDGGPNLDYQWVQPGTERARRQGHTSGIGSQWLQNCKRRRLMPEVGEHWRGRGLRSAPRSPQTRLARGGSGGRKNDDADGADPASALLSCARP